MTRRPMYLRNVGGRPSLRPAPRESDDGRARRPHRKAVMNRCQFLKLGAVMFLAACAPVLFLAPQALYAQSAPASARPIAGLGHAHMDTSCSPGVSADFDRALALLHNFWYARALEAFREVAQRDPDCAIAYWGAAKTYDHPFWDPPTRSDESAAWALVQRGLRAPRKSPREDMYLAAVAALYKEGGAGPKAARGPAYVDAMATAYAAYPDDETKLFYGLAVFVSRTGRKKRSREKRTPGQRLLGRSTTA